MYKTRIVCNQLNRKVLFYFSAVCPHPDSKTLWKTMHHNEGRRGSSLSRSLSLTYTHLIKPLDPP